jgi:hypothetical protein
MDGNSKKEKICLRGARSSVAKPKLLLFADFVKEFKALWTVGFEVLPSKKF